MTTEITLVPSPSTSLCAGWQFPSSKRGAWHARLAAQRQLTAWGWSQAEEFFQDVALIVSELASNAVTHGHLRGRDFQLHLLLGPCPGLPTVLRIEVSDSRAERLPELPGAPEYGAEAGRGLLLVDALVDRWGVVPRPPSGKTLWCELDLTANQQE